MDDSYKQIRVYIVDKPTGKIEVRERQRHRMKQAHSPVLASFSFFFGRATATFRSCLSKAASLSSHASRAAASANRFACSDGFLPLDIRGSVADLALAQQQIQI